MIPYDSLLGLILLAELRNDHKEITEKINENIEALHSARLAPRTSFPKESGMAEIVGIVSASI